jgi:chromosome segregation ATPase
MSLPSSSSALQRLERLKASCEDKYLRIEEYQKKSNEYARIINEMQANKRSLLTNKRLLLSIIEDSLAQTVQKQEMVNDDIDCLKKEIDISGKYLNELEATVMDITTGLNYNNSELLDHRQKLQNVHTTTQERSLMGAEELQSLTYELKQTDGIIHSQNIVWLMYSTVF